MNTNTNTETQNPLAGLVVLVVMFVLGAIGLRFIADLFATPVSPEEMELRRKEREEANRRRAAAHAEHMKRVAAERENFYKKFDEAYSAKNAKHDPLVSTLSLLLGVPSTTLLPMRTVAIYNGLSTYGRPARVIHLDKPLVTDELALVPTEGGVEVRYLGSFRMEVKQIDRGRHEYLFGRDLTVQVL